jgi:hypothetical protein
MTPPAIGPALILLSTGAGLLVAVGLSGAATLVIVVDRLPVPFELLETLNDILDEATVVGVGLVCGRATALVGGGMVGTDPSPLIYVSNCAYECSGSVDLIKYTAVNGMIDSCPWFVTVNVAVAVKLGGETPTEEVMLADGWSELIEQLEVRRNTECLADEGGRESSL